jgi:hypothetical protein
MGGTMEGDETQRDEEASRAVAETHRLSRRQALGRMSVVATAGAAAWVVPEILTARAAGGATLSVASGPSSLNGTLEPPDEAPVPHATPANRLAFTGLNIQLDAELGAALIAGGWAMHHWASRTSTPPTEGPGAPA